MKKTETLIKTEYGSDPSTIPNISWEGGTTQKFNLYRKETYSIREGFTTRTEERIYNYKYPYEYLNNFDEVLSRKKGIIDFYSE